MMGAPLSTANYFPMVDGARYDYLHTGGPWASSSMVMRGGQSWAGRDGLYAMHYAYMCNAGVASNPALAPNTACNQNGGTLCDGNSGCVDLTFMVVRVGDGTTQPGSSSAAWHSPCSPCSDGK